MSSIVFGAFNKGWTKMYWIQVQQKRSGKHKRDLLHKSECIKFEIVLSRKHGICTCEAP